MTRNNTSHIESSKIGPGDILTFGGLDLLLTLNLSPLQLVEYNVKWDDLSSLENLQFLKKNNKLWKQVELSSTDDSMKLLLQVNKSSKKLIKIGYVILKNLSFTNIQMEYKEFIKTVTNDNGLFMTSCPVCNCHISLKLKIIFDDKEKVFELATGKEENAETSNDENPFFKINKDIANPQD